MNNITKLIVKYNDIVVGYLVDSNGDIAFQYSEEWIKDGFSISPFSLPLSRKVYICKKKTFDGLYGVFADSLPDGWGALLLDRMLIKKGINPEKVSPLTKLSLLNETGLGGLTYEPCQSEKINNIEINFDAFAKETKLLLENESNVTDFDTIYYLGGSSCGARPKVHIKIDDEYWIIKFPCLLDPLNIGEQEYNANKLAKECGINVNEFKLFPSKICSGFFGAKRFDRLNGKRIHMISLSSLLETSHRIPNLDYKHLFQVIESICSDQSSLYEAYRRMCFNVIYQNKDDHGKNFSFLYDENKKSYVLSPFYDITKTPNKIEHEMTINGKANPDISDLRQFGKEMKLSSKQCDVIINNILKTLHTKN